MRFKQFSGTAVVPFMARVVLAIAFVTVGYNKIFTTMIVESPADLQTLRDAGVSLAPPEVPGIPGEPGDTADGDAGGEAATPPPPPNGAVGATGTIHRGSAGPQFILAGLVQPAGGENAGALPPPSTAPDAAPEAPEPLPASAEVRSLHGITMMLTRAAAGSPDGGPRVPAFVGDYAVWLAWIAALTEFLGGVMLLFGMLTRVWGLGIATAMVTAFWLTTVPAFAAVDSSGVVSQSLLFAADIPAYNRAVAQLALFVLALGLVLTGAGPLSVDAILFARDPHRDIAKAGDPHAQPIAPAVPAGGAAMTPGSVAAPMGAAAGTAYAPPGVQMPPSAGHVPPANTDAWGTPVAPVPPAAPAPEIPLQSRENAAPIPPVAPAPQSSEALPSMPQPGEEDWPTPEDDVPPGVERPRPTPGQSFGGEGRPL